MNCYIETLSLMKKVFPPRQFRLDDQAMVPSGAGERRFSGQQTNEPQTKYYIWKLAQQKQVLDRIIVIVTKECVEDLVESTEGQTSFQFYQLAIVQFLNELCEENTFFKYWLQKHHGGNAEAYLQAIMKPVMIPERMETAYWRSIISMISERPEKEPLHLYFDFTGGSRVASLISLLLLRTIEGSQGAEVRQVIYSDVQDPNDPKLVECTGNYAIVSSLEQIAVASAGGEDSSSKITDALILLGIADDTEKAVSQRIDDARGLAEAALRKSDQAHAKEMVSAVDLGAKSTTSIAGGYQRKVLESARAASNTSAFQKLCKRNDATLIKDFHEEIMGILMDEKVIRFTGKTGKKDPKDKLKELLKINQEYYEKTLFWFEFDRRTGRSERVSYPAGVCPQVHRWLETLSFNPQMKPLDVLQAFCDVRREEYVCAVNRLTYVNGINARNAERYLQYLEEHHIEPNEYDFFDVDDWQRVYFNLGFPFACVFNSTVYPEISNYYLQKAKRLMKMLEAQQLQDPNVYSDTLKRLLSEPDKLEMEIPLMVKMSQWSVEQTIFASPAEANSFVTTLCSRIEQVRPYRNAVAHNLENEYRRPERQRDIADRIRGWLEEYDVRFAAKDGDSNRQND